MVGVWVFRVLIIGLVLFIFNPSWVAAKMTLEERWNLLKDQSKPDIQEDVLEVLKDRDFIFVPGILNELGMFISVYYSDTVSVVQGEIGAKASYVLPDSRLSFSKNATKIYQEIRTTFENRHKPIVVEGHSKGGAELFHAVLRHPNLIWDHIVDRVVLLQPAIGGSPLVEKSDMGYALSMFRYVLRSGLASLDPIQAQKEQQISLAQFEYILNARFGAQGPDVVEKKRKEISDRIFYVRSRKSSDHLSLGTRIVLSVCKNSLADYGDNDGLLLVADQKSDAIGVDLGVLDGVDHVDLSVGSIFSNMSPKHRKAFSKALWMQIYQNQRP